MKTLWNITSFLAMVNLLALVMFGGWLWQSGRLDRERVHAIRDMLSPSDENAALEEARGVVSEEGAAVEGGEETRRATPALPSGMQVNQLSAMNTREVLTLRRLEDEKNMLVEQLRLQSQKMREEREAFDAVRAAWEQATKADRDRKSDEQFKKTIDLYQSVPAKQAKSMLVELVDRGQTRQAIAYLDAMDTRTAAKILRELKTDTENELATELLEQLRTFGVAAGVTKESGNADNADELLSNNGGTGP
jgi:hypothetical protein